MFQLHDAPKGVARSLRKAVVTIPKKGEGRDYSELAKHLQKVQAKVPGLTTALIIPRAETIYEDVIELMDELKKSGMISLGVSPL